MLTWGNEAKIKAKTRLSAGAVWSITGVSKENMNSEDRDLQRRLRELEEQVSRQTNQGPGQTPLNTDWRSSLNELKPRIEQFFGNLPEWYRGLPSLGKVGVVVVGIMLGLSALRTVFSLISLAVSLTILGAIGYIGYKLFFAPDSPDK